jgi:hypothetical protein
MALLVAALEMPGNPDLAHLLSVGGTLLYDPYSWITFFKEQIE